MNLAMLESELQQPTQQLPQLESDPDAAALRGARNSSGEPIVERGPVIGRYGDAIIYDWIAFADGTRRAFVGICPSGVAPQGEILAAGGLLYQGAEPASDDGSGASAKRQSSGS